MGNNAIIIRTIGCHHNGLADVDAEQIAKRTVEELRAAGHSILTATVESGGGSIDLAAPECSLRTVTNPDAPACAAYERYLSSSGGKSLVSGAELPGWEALSPEIKAAWMAAVDHTKPRLKR